MGKLFGTDGVRGVANRQLTAELAVKLGRAAAMELGRHAGHPRVVLGRDTRTSGPMLEHALAAGVMSAGSDVICCGILPTPAVAFLVGLFGAQAGAVISASHNPFQDNGIKFFGPDGFKLDDESEARIEQAVKASRQVPVGSTLGSCEELGYGDRLYVDHALAALEGRRLDGVTVVLDCANGASFRTSPDAFRRSGARVIPMNADPDGLNINASCGSAHPELLARRVLEYGADVGLAHDGDADRVIAVDEQGVVVDGDAMIALLALELKEHGKLCKNLVVTTVMANLGFRRAMAAHAIEVVETPVGDRFVLEAMRKRGAAIGGEQSGHVIFTDMSTTGDGLITGLRLAARMVSTGRRLSDLAGVVKKFPQVLLNVKTPDPRKVESSREIRQAISRASRRLGDSGRVLVRASGTEPLVRVMVEATEAGVAASTAQDLADVILGELG